VARNPLDVLLRLRDAAQDEAKRAFAARLAEEAVAQRLMEEAEARMTREREIATDPNLGDGAVEAYIAWLPTGRRQAQAAQAAYERAMENVTLARAALSVAHATAEAMTTLLQQQIEAAADLTARQTQTALDEIAARLPPQPGRGPQVL
jgi:flagellar biosynthesis chaperone FliJ